MTKNIPLSVLSPLVLVPVLMEYLQKRELFPPLIGGGGGEGFGGKAPKKGGFFFFFL